MTDRTIGCHSCKVRGRNAGAVGNRMVATIRIYHSIYKVIMQLHKCSSKAARIRLTLMPSSSRTPARTFPRCWTR